MTQFLPKHNNSFSSNQFKKFNSKIGIGQDPIHSKIKSQIINPILFRILWLKVLNNLINKLKILIINNSNNNITSNHNNSIKSKLNHSNNLIRSNISHNNSNSTNCNLNKFSSNNNSKQINHNNKLIWIITILWLENLLNN